MRHSSLTAVLYGDVRDSSLSLPLCRSLERLGGVIYVGPGCVSVFGQGQRCLLAELGRPESCGGEEALLILKRDEPFPREMSLPPRLTVIAAQPKPEDFPPGRAVEWISCGGVNNTLALSSLREDCAVVELRRTVSLPGGGTREPGELLFRLPAPMEGYPLLCCCAVELLLEPWRGS
ncbi:MAG: hypothetical protein LBJ11_09750 [Oscillospiraceae bacterium]|nr:hypothetical protein [Oscillospiraceae bacterium]